MPPYTTNSSQTYRLVKQPGRDPAASYRGPATVLGRALFARSAKVYRPHLSAWHVSRARTAGYPFAEAALYMHASGPSGCWLVVDFFVEMGARIADVPPPASMAARWLRLIDRTADEVERERKAA